MTRHGSGAQILVAIAVLMGIVVAAPAARAQTDKQYVFRNGNTVSWDAPWMRDAESSTRNEDIELLGLTTSIAIVGVGSTTSAVPGAEVRDIILGKYAADSQLRQIDRGGYDNIWYSLDLAGEESIELAVFTLVIEHPQSTGISVVLAPAAQFEAALTAAQSGVRVDGTGLFEGVDAAQMQQVIDRSSRGATLPGDADATRPAVALSTPTPLPLLPTEPPATSPDAGGGLIGGLNTGPGGAGASAFTIPSNGAVVTYSADWEIYDQSDTSVQLVTVGSPVVFAGAIDVGPQPTDATAAAIASALVADADSSIVDARDLDNGRRVIVLAQADTAGSIYFIYDMTLDPESTTAFLLTVYKEDVDAAVELATSTIQLNSQPLLTGLRERIPAIFTPAAGGAHLD